MIFYRVEGRGLWFVGFAGWSISDVSSIEVRCLDSGAEMKNPTSSPYRNRHLKPTMKKEIANLAALNPGNPIPYLQGPRSIRSRNKNGAQQGVPVELREAVHRQEVLFFDPTWRFMGSPLIWVISTLTLLVLITTHEPPQ